MSDLNRVAPNTEEPIPNEVDASNTAAVFPNEADAPLSPLILEALDKIALEHHIKEYDIHRQPIAGLGENSYGLIFQATLTPTQVLPSFAAVQPFNCILKISPKFPARRNQMNVVGYYRREIFMYENVLSKYLTLHAEEQQFDIIPHLYNASMADQDEFLIIEDLTQSQFTQNSRANMPTYDLVGAALCALAKLHAYSFVLQAQKPLEFATIIAQLDDNLFTEDMEEVTVQFGINSLRRARLLLEQETDIQSKQYVQILQKFENDFQKIGLRCVNGEACEPYAVICHGDFWNNNILYKYDSNKKAIAAKLIDFQLSRYGSPVLDVVHYLFVCTEKVLRDSHYTEFLQIYYDALSQNIGYFGLDPTVIYPKTVFDNHLHEYGAYGLIMSAFAVPFFISNMDEIPDLNAVSQAVQDRKRYKAVANTCTNADSGASEPEDASNDDRASASEVVCQFDFITPRTLPIIKKRMTDIVADLIKYDMFESVARH